MDGEEVEEGVGEDVVDEGPKITVAGNVDPPKVNTFPRGICERPR